MESLVSTEWLESQLGAEDLTILDASWHMPASGRDARAEFAERHIPGARFFDIDQLSDREAKAPHMLPPAQAFSAAMRELGVSEDDRIVIYDDSPLRTSARAWFMLRHFGPLNVAILDGGLGKWLAEGRPVEAGSPPRRKAYFDALPASERVVDKDTILKGRDFPLLDARGAARFTGAEPDPRPGVEPGHIPGARNLPYSAFYREDGTFRSAGEIRSAFADAGIDPAQPFIATCGSGVTANSLIFAAHLLGNDRTRLYDGSWSEWGADPATPKELGPSA